MNQPARASHAHEIEPELLQATPRKVRRKSGARLGCSFVPLLFFGYLSAVTLPEALSATRLLVADEVPGRVLGYRVLRGKRSRSRWMRYRYSWRDQTLQSERQVWETEPTLPIGAELRVKAIGPGPRDARARLPDQSDFGPTLATVFLWGLALFGSASFVAYFDVVVFSPRREQHLIRFGQIERAIITNVEPLKNKSRGAKFVKVSYEFTTNQRLSARGESILSQDVAPQIGAREKVLFSPQRPRLNMLYRFSNYEAIVPDETARS